MKVLASDEPPKNIMKVLAGNSQTVPNLKQIGDNLDVLLAKKDDENANQVLDILNNVTSVKGDYDRPRLVEELL